MKRIFIITLCMPIYLHAQTAAPRRPLTIDRLNNQSTRKDLLQLRDKLKTEATGEHNTYHDIPHTSQQKPSQK